MEKKQKKSQNKSSNIQSSKNQRKSKIVNQNNSIKDIILELNNEFDESIYFNHKNTFFAKLSVEKPISKTNIPFLIKKEFEFSYFEDKLKNKESNKESIPQILDHIKQFSNSQDINYIIYFLEKMNSYAEIIGIKNTSHLLVPSLVKILDEPFSIKMKFLSNLLPLIDYVNSKGYEGIIILKKKLINIILELYQQKNEDNIFLSNDEYKKLLFQNFIKISKAILVFDKENFIINIIFGFGNEDNIRNNFVKLKKVEEHKILCIRIIRNLVEGIGKDNTEKYLITQLISFSCEKNEDIKKELLFSLPSISETISYRTIYTKIYDILRRLSIDPSSNIRKICVNVLAKIIKIFKNKCQQEIKNNNENINENANENTNENTNRNENNINIKNYSATKFVSLIEKLAKDKENNVKYTIIEKIGEIISPLNKDELSKELFYFYIQLIENYYKEKKGQLPRGTNSLSKPSFSSSENKLFSKDDNWDENDETSNMDKEYNKQITEEDLNYYFVFNFPAILFCYGNDIWPELKQIYYNFCSVENLKIRLSIIASFHEIVNILGEEITVNDLLPLYDKFLESKDQQVQKLSIKNLPKILLKLNKKLKEKYYKYFEPISIFTDSIGSKIRNFNFIKWKDKLNVIEGILFYYNIFNNDIIYNSILPQCITFCLDIIYKVRKTSSKVLANLIVYLYKENFKKDKLFKILENFAFHKKFQIRINFIKMCPILCGDENLYKEKIKELIEILANKDKIIDVKIALGKILKKIIKNEKEILNKDDFIHKICNILCKNDFIKKMFKGVNIKNVNEETNNIIEDKIYFKENNSFFIEEFNIEFEKRDNKLFSRNKNVKKNINKNADKKINKEKENKQKIKDENKKEIDSDKNKIKNDKENKEEKEKNNEKTDNNIIIKEKETSEKIEENKEIKEKGEEKGEIKLEENIEKEKDNKSEKEDDKKLINVIKEYIEKGDKNDE